MAIDPPEDLPTWDTDDNNSTDPGAAKRADGWNLNEVPSSAHMNWLHQQTTEWVNYLQKMTAPMTFLRNMVLTDDTAFASSGAGMCHIRYVDGLGKYLAVTRAGSGTMYAYESTDGITWTNETSLGSTGPISKIASDGVDIVCFRYENELMTSSTGSVAGLTYQGNSLNGGSVRDDMDLVYDPVNDYYIATGAKTSGRSITRPIDVHYRQRFGIFVTPGFLVAPIRFEGIAVSTATGKAICYFSRTSVRRYQRMAATPGHRRLVSVQFTTPIYSPASRCFFAFDDANNKLYYMPDIVGADT